MIYFLVLALILFLPGNIVLFAITSMFFTPSRFIKREFIHNLIYLFLIWTLIGCFFSKSFLVSFYGCVYRVEGWLMWLIMARMAWAYWSEFEDVDPLIIFIFTLCVLYILGITFFGYGYFNNMSVAGFSAVAFAMVWSVNKQLSVVAILPVILLTSNRSAIAASLLSVVVPILFLKNKKVLVYSSALIVFLVALCFFITPIKERFLHFHITNGDGFRMQLAGQAAYLYGHLPITGFGLDSLVFHLTNPVGVGFQDHSVAERTHNVCYDLVLMTGWIGYLICLAMLGACIWVTIRNPSMINVSCLSGVVAWIAFGMVNPQGCGAHALMMTCLFGFKKREKDE